MELTNECKLDIVSSRPAFGSEWMGSDAMGALTTLALRRPPLKLILATS